MSHPFNGEPTPNYSGDSNPYRAHSHSGMPTHPHSGMLEYSSPDLYRTGGVTPASHFGTGYGYGVPSQVPPGYNQKNWVVALLLAFFLGSFGAHNFYLGRTGRGSIQLAMTLLSWLTVIILIGFVGLAIVGIWVFVDFLLILTGSGGYDRDSNGFPLER
ncbi:TM2 domain-containing protein [Corynebacterium auriscanis]|uniref:TM2 domain-containing protein n=2 Tax=Corynebacterium auriscanis TaxID=99807 RepID=UPI0012EBFCD9|nr:TM2 domain protein [Corynebacterium auriscanis]